MNIKKLNEKYNEAINLEDTIYNDEDDKKLEKNKKALLEIYKSIFDEVYEECKIKNIKRDKDFEKAYNKIDFMLSSIILDYIISIDECTYYDKNYYNIKKDVIEKVLQQFKFDKEDELFIQREYGETLFRLGNKKEGIKLLQELKEKDGESESAYSYLCMCLWEDKERNIEKVASLLDEAYKKGIILYFTDIYEELVEYYNGRGENDIADYYKSILEKQKEVDEEIDDYDFDEDYDKNEQEMREGALNYLSELLHSDVDKNKLYSDYLNDIDLKNLIELYHINKNDNLITILEHKDPKSYVLKNKEEIIKEVLKSMPKSNISNLKKMIKKNYKVVNIDTYTENINELHSIIDLVNIGILFGQVVDDDIILHLPGDIAEIINKVLNSDEFKAENKTFDKIYNLFMGCFQAYGVIDLGSLYDIYNDIFKRSEYEYERDLTLFDCYSKVVEYIYSKNGKYIEYAYFNVIPRERAEQIARLNSNFKYERYPFEVYKKLSNDTFIENTKAYKEFKKELFETRFINIDDFPELKYLALNQYIIIRRIDEEEAERILREDFSNVFKEDVVENPIESMANLVAKYFRKIYEELPDWNKGGKIENRT